MVTNCAALKYTIDNAVSLPEPDWYYLGVMASYCEDGREHYHKASEHYRGYSIAETDAKFDAALRNAPGPTTCSYISQNLSAGIQCEGCIYRDKIKTPLSLGKADPLVFEYDYVRSLDRFVHRANGDTLSKDGLNNAEAHRQAGGGRNTPAKRILTSPVTVKAQRLDYRPGQQKYIMLEGGECVLNTWQPNLLTPIEGNPLFFFHHVEYLIPNKAERKHFLDAFAYLLQKPGTRLGHAILIIGSQGTGKSYLGRVLRQLFGMANSRQISSSELFSPYTAWLANTQLVVIEELRGQNGKRGANELKALITEPDVRVNEKYIPVYEIQNHASFLAFTNEDEPIHLDHDDRRYMVIKSPAIPKDATYYDSLYVNTNSSIGAILNALLQRDVSDFRPQ